MRAATRQDFLQQIEPPSPLGCFVVKVTGFCSGRFFEGSL